MKPLISVALKEAHGLSRLSCSRTSNQASLVFERIQRHMLLSCSFPALTLVVQRHLLLSCSFPALTLVVDTAWAHAKHKLRIMMPPLIQSLPPTVLRKQGVRDTKASVAFPSK